jgi:ADP-heptose:LPS heptosyltransferase
MPATSRAARSGEFERALDRYAGIPLLFCLGLLRRRRTLPAAPRRIGVLQPTAIGDMFLISGLLRHLHERFPQAELHIFHGPSNAAALALLPVDTVGHCCRFKEPWQALREIRAAELDVLINCAPWTRLTALLTALSGARATLGFRSAGQHIHPAFDIAVPYAPDRHEIENHRALAEQFGRLDRYRPSVRLREPPLPIDLPFSRLVLLHVAAGGSRAQQKSWPAERWAALARLLVARGWVVAFTGTEADAPTIDPILAAARLPPEQGRSLAGRLSLPQLAHVLARARLLVTVDTGLLHLAAALDSPVLGLHGPTRFERWGACNAAATGLNAPHPAAGYIHYGFERHREGDAIMHSLSVDAVAAAALAWLEPRMAEQGAVASVA